ncbi:hypothetical protein GIB67_042230 [Kingdonia uniflora]|uniref:Uncharacterized protein n=1 Tax=Kingdonia uniflora TaxID=39325 RepID=A0A7J7LDW2_9MAGN|nr:hypothetical protein GIB67_042230 [Kingdonia uniflora]
MMEMKEKWMTKTSSKTDNEGHEEWVLLKFLESWELSDVLFVFGAKVVPAYKVILGAGASGCFPLMPLDLLKKLEKSIFNIQIPVIGQLVTEAIEYLDSGMQQGNNQNVIYQHRRSSFKELQYICDGDNNGVIYFAGTSYGEHQ